MLVIGGEIGEDHGLAATDTPFCDDVRREPWSDREDTVRAEGTVDSGLSDHSSEVNRRYPKSQHVSHSTASPGQGISSNFAGNLAFGISRLRIEIASNLWIPFPTDGHGVVVLSLVCRAGFLHTHGTRYSTA
jgi:hypothetical protein